MPTVTLAAEGLAGALVIGAILPEARDTAVDDAGIDPAQALIVDAELRLDVGAEVLDHDVGLLGQALEGLKSPGILQVERHRPLVAVQVLEIRTMARAARLLAGGILYQGVDLDDVGTPIRELAYARALSIDCDTITADRSSRWMPSAQRKSVLLTLIFSHLF